MTETRYGNTYWCTYCDTAIYGIGETETDAWQEPREAGCNLDGLKVARCTPALYAQVDLDGGAIAWGSLADGTQCTIEEEDAAAQKGGAA